MTEQNDLDQGVLARGGRVELNAKTLTRDIAVVVAPPNEVLAVAAATFRFGPHQRPGIDAGGIAPRLIPASSADVTGKLIAVGGRNQEAADAENEGGDLHQTRSDRARRKPIPKIGPLDALVRITTTTICGTDIHILKGEYPVAQRPTIGHEPVGVIEKLGSSVAMSFGEGQRVIAA